MAEILLGDFSELAVQTFLWQVSDHKLGIAGRAHFLDFPRALKNAEEAIVAAVQKEVVGTIQIWLCGQVEEKNFACAFLVESGCEPVSCGEYRRIGGHVTVEEHITAAATNYIQIQQWPLNVF